MQSATLIPCLTLGFDNIQLSSGVDIHNESSKPTLANAREEAQAAVRQSSSPLKRKFDGDNNEEKLHRPRKLTCGAHGPWETEREVRRITMLGEPRRLAFLASTYGSAESRAQLTKPGEPEMSREEVQAAVREPSPLWDPMRLIYDIKGDLLPYESEEESTDGESVYDTGDALYDTDDANSEEEFTDDEEESADDEKEFVDELRRELQFLVKEESAEMVDEIRRRELQFLESADEDQSANDEEESTDDEEQSENDEEESADDDVMMW